MGLIARELEENGIATVTLSMFEEVAKYVVPPRTLLTNFPFGAPFGDPHNYELHLAVITEALKLLKEDTPGILVQLPYKWKEEL